MTKKCEFCSKPLPSAADRRFCNGSCAARWREQHTHTKKAPRGTTVAARRRWWNQSRSSQSVTLKMSFDELLSDFRAGKRMRNIAKGSGVSLPRLYQIRSKWFADLV
jgi:hypothetical protein